MAKVKITGHASGTGVITVTAPNTSTDRTITLPDATATIATTTDVAARLPSITDGGNATAMTIDSSERIGIGTGSPTRKVHIVDNSNYSLSVIKSGENIHMAQFASDGTAALGIAVDDNNNLVRLNSEGSNDSLQLEVADGTVGIKIDSTGAVTMPAQPAFLVNATGSSSDISVNTDTKVNYNAEVFDQNSDFNTSTQTFTAPVTGKYQFNVQLLWIDWDSSASYYYLQLITSNRTHYELVTASSRPSDPIYSYGHIHTLTDMDAGDTAYINVLQADGSTQTGYNAQSIWTGHLAC